MNLRVNLILDIRQAERRAPIRDLVPAAILCSPTARLINRLDSGSVVRILSMERLIQSVRRPWQRKPARHRDSLGPVRNAELLVQSV